MMRRVQLNILPLIVTASIVLDNAVAFAPSKTSVLVPKKTLVNRVGVGTTTKTATTTTSSSTAIPASKDDYVPLDGEQKINLKHDLESSKVATMEDVCSGDKKVYCRCWLSGTFPLCDGAHVAHNKATGDNVGPLIVSVPKKAPVVQDNEKKADEIKTTAATTTTASVDGMDKKVEGRKKRVIMGSKVAAVASLAFTGTTLAKRGLDVASIYFTSGHVLAAGVAYIMISAAANDRLSSDTYKRLNLCMIEFGLVNLLLGATFSQFRKNPMFVAAAFFTTINSIKAYAYGVLGWAKDNKEASLVGDILDGTKSTIKGFFTLPKNIKSLGYLLATATVGTMKVAKLLDIGKLVLEGGQTMVVATRLSRFARLAFMTMVFYTLKDAADRGRLEGTTFIELNFLSSLVMAAMAAYLGALTPLGGAAAFFSVFSAANGGLSVLKKKAKA